MSKNILLITFYIMSYIKKNDFDFNYRDLTGYDYNRISASAMSVTNSTNEFIQYHNTVIVEFNWINNTIKLNSNGWYSPTTKKYMNDFLSQLDMYIQQKDFTWYIIKNGGGIQWKKDLEKRLDSGDIIEYFDRITIDLDWNLINN